MHNLFMKQGLVTAEVIAGKETKKRPKFKDYFSWSEKLATIPSHRLLAVRTALPRAFSPSASPRPKNKQSPSSRPCSSPAAAPPPSRSAWR